MTRCEKGQEPSTSLPLERCTRRFPGPSLEGSIRAATAAAPSADGGGNAAGLAQPTGACVPPAGDGGML